MTLSHSPIHTFLIVFSKKYANMELTGWFIVFFYGRVFFKKEISINLKPKAADSCLGNELTPWTGWATDAAGRDVFNTLKYGYIIYDCLNFLTPKGEGLCKFFLFKSMGERGQRPSRGWGTLNLVAHSGSPTGTYLPCDQGYGYKGLREFDTAINWWYLFRHYQLNSIKLPSLGRLDWH